MAMAYHAEAQRRQRVIDRKHEAMLRLRERAVRIELAEINKEQYLAPVQL